MQADELPDLAAIARWGHRTHDRLPAFLDGVGDAELARTMEFPLAPSVVEQLGGSPTFPTMGEMLLHIACHSVHHRAQVNTRLRDLGGEPPWIDLIAWLLHGKPQPEWPELGNA